MIDANGNRAELSYDGFDRLKRWTFPSNAPGFANAADYEEYGYDPVGNRTSLRKRDNSTLTYLYDNLNRVIRKTVPERSGLASAQTRDVYYDYDHALGLQTKARFDSLDGEGLAAWYDAFGQPVTSLSTMGGQFRYVTRYFDDSGNLHGLGHPDGISFDYDHDSLGRVTAAYEHRSAPSIDDYLVRYWYNPAGSRHSAVRGANGIGFYAVYYRDPLQRLQILANDLPGAANDAPIELARNAAGQIVARTAPDSYAAPTPANTSRGYQVNGLNQYTGTTYAGAPNWSFEYDPNGNLTRSVDPVGADTTAYLYDVENRLVAASGARNATLVYDPLGRLSEVTDGNGAKTRFLFDGDRMIAEYDGAENLTKRYVHGPGADEPIAVYEGAGLGLANRRYPMPDERGSIMALVDADGTPSVRNRYDAWGVPGAGNAGRFQYTGQAWIAELGLYYYKARFYSPWLGRFMQVDPIGYEDHMNLYAYVGNDPINGTDPSGLYTCEETECRAVGKAVQALGRAAENARMNNTGSRLPSMAARVLTSAVRALGTEGQGGIHIQNAKLETGTLGEYSPQENGSRLIKMDFQQIKEDGGIPIAAAVLGHEVTHVAQDMRHGPPRTLEALSVRERQAYRVGAWTMEALGWRHPTLPSMADKDFEGRIRQAAKNNCISSSNSYEDSHDRQSLLPGNCQ